MLPDRTGHILSISSGFQPVPRMCWKRAGKIIPP